ncbi:MAG: HAD hydrolase family protein [Roseburia sp.]|nr:HAD hydrolase family protein [Roseburia sp.]
MIKLIVMDVDGTLTDGGLYYSNEGAETKKFCVKDGIGILMVQAVEKKCMIMTGKESDLVKKRAEDLHIEHVFQGIHNKKRCLMAFMKKEQVAGDEILYIGDDLNDLGAMQIAGRVGCPADAAEEVKLLADFISVYTGGNGAVRDILFKLLKEEGLYEKAIENVYGSI